MSSVEVVFLDGAAGGIGFTTDAFDFPPPDEVRIVTGGKNGPELLACPDDEVRPGEQLHIYRREFVGSYKQGRSCGFFGAYRLGRSAPDPEPSLFDAGLRLV